MTSKIKTKLTPVRYPGGKSNALKFLDSYFPKNFDEYREPFFGGGSVGLYLMQTHKDATYWINDLFYPVYCFWNILYNNPDKMVEMILFLKKNYMVGKSETNIKGIPSKNALAGKALHEFCRENIKKSIDQKHEFDTAYWWYILNKTSYSGMAMIGSYAPLAWDQNFSDDCIKNLPKTSELMHSVKNIKITNLDYSELLKNGNDNTFTFLDPPYDIKDFLYGDKGNMHRSFNHHKFSDDIKKCNHRWMITYNNNEKIREWFDKYNKIPWELQYTMKATRREGQEGSSITGKSGKVGKELLILNYDNKTQE